MQPQQHRCAHLLGDAVIFFLTRDRLALRVIQVVVVVLPQPFHVRYVFLQQFLTHSAVIHRVSALNLGELCLVSKLVIAVFDHRANSRLVYKHQRGACMLGQTSRFDVFFVY